MIESSFQSFFKQRRFLLPASQTWRFAVFICHMWRVYCLKVLDCYSDETSKLKIIHIFFHRVQARPMTEHQGLSDGRSGHVGLYLITYCCMKLFEVWSQKMKKCWAWFRVKQILQVTDLFPQFGYFLFYMNIFDVLLLTKTECAAAFMEQDFPDKNICLMKLKWKRKKLKLICSGAICATCTAASSVSGSN